MKKVTSSLVIALAMTSIATTFGNTAQARPTGKMDVENRQTVVNLSLSETEVRQAQESWGKALIQISTEHDKKGLRTATETAKKIIDAAYGYQLGTVLFKPTLTSGDQTFRTSKEGALAYFVGGNKAYPNDSGFALKGWREFKNENAGVFINGDVAMTMGKVHLTDKNGQVTTVDKTWAFKKMPSGEVKIVLHHSSLPYQPTSGTQAKAH